MKARWGAIVPLWDGAQYLIPLRTIQFAYLAVSIWLNQRDP